MTDDAPSCRQDREPPPVRVKPRREEFSRMRLARRLAPEYLRYYVICPKGVDLVPWLATSRCRCNAEALVEWIEAQLEDPMLTEGAEQTPASIVIAHRLECRLALVEASCPW